MKKDEQIKFVSTILLEPGMIVGKPIYRGNQILLEEDVVLTPEIIEKIDNMGLDGISVKEKIPVPEQDILDTVALDFAGIPEKAGVELTDQVIAKEKKISQENTDFFKVTAESLKENHKKILEGAHSDLSGLEEIVSKIISRIQVSKPLLLSRMAPEESEPYIASHCVKTAIYALCTALDSKFSASDLTKLGIACLMHDIGMLDVPDKFWNKPEKATDNDMIEIRKHVHKSATIMGRVGIPNTITEIVMQHHEREDHTGYPKGIARNDIDKKSKIMSIADVFAALSSDRLYRKAYEKQEVMKILLNMTASVLNGDIMQTFFLSVPLYPVGAIVTLNNGETGQVYGSTRNPFRPIIDIIKDKHGKPLVRPRRVDLANPQNLGLYVVMEAVHIRDSK